MADAKKTVIVDLQVVSNADKAVKDLIGNFKKLLDGVKDVTDKLKAATDPLSKAKVSPSIINALETIAKLDGVRLPALGAFVGQLEKLAGLGKFSNLDGFAKTLEKLQGISAPNISGFITQLGKLGNASTNLANAASVIRQLRTEISKFPSNVVDLSSLAKGITSLSKASSKITDPAAFQSITHLTTALDGLKGMKIPNINNLFKGMEGIKNFDDKSGKLAINLTSLASALRLFKGIQMPGISGFVKGLEALKKLDIGDVVSKLFQLSKAIDRMSKGGHLNAFATFAKDINDLSNNINKIIPQLDRVKTAMNGVAKAATSASQGGKGFGERLVNYLQYRVIADSIFKMQDAFYGTMSVIRDFDQALFDLKAITGATEAEVAKMSDTIIDVAGKTKFSASEIAEGMKLLGQAGYTASESIAAIGPISDLATGTLSGMAESVDLVTTVLSVFDIEATKTAQVVDVLAMAINKSKLDVDKLRIAFNYVGPIAADAGVSFQETAASMMVLANSGQRASTIGTSLRRLFSDLIDPPAKFAAAIENAGFTIDDLDPRMSSLSEVLSKLNLVITDAGQAFDIFGKLGASSVITLKDSQGGFQDMLLAVGQSGEAAKMAATQTQGLGIMYKNLLDKVQLLGIAIGNAGLTGFLKGLVNVTRELVDGLAVLINSGFGSFIIKTGLAVSSAAAFLVVAGKLKEAFVAIRTVMLLNATAGASLWIPGMTGAHAYHKIITLIGNTLSGLPAVLGRVAGALTGMSAATNLIKASPILMFVAALGALYNAIDGIDKFRESSEKASKEAVDFSQFKTGMDTYTKDISTLSEGSDEYATANKNLRKELLTVADGTTVLSGAAREAAESIDPLTGSIDKGSDALKRYQEQLDKVTIAKFSQAYNDAMKNVQSQTSGAARAWSGFKNGFTEGWDGIGTAVASLFNKALDADGIKALEAKAQEIQLGKKVAQKIKEDLDQGKLAWDDFAKYIETAVARGLVDEIPEQKELVDMFVLADEKAKALFATLTKNKDFSSNMSTEAFEKLAIDSGVANDKIAGVLTVFNSFKKAIQIKDTKTVAAELVKEFEDGKGKIESYIGTYSKLGGVVTDQEKQAILAIEATKKALADKYIETKKEYDLAKEKGTLTQADVEKRIRYEQDFLVALQKANKDGHDNFKYYSIQKVKLIQDGLEKELKSIDASESIKEERYRKRVEATMKAEREMKAAMEAVYSVKELKERYQTEIKEVELANEEKLHQVAMMEAASTTFHAEAEKKRYQVTSERYNREVELAKQHVANIEAALDSDDTVKSDAQQKLLDAERERTEFTRKELETRKKEETRAAKEILDIQKKIVKEVTQNEVAKSKAEDKYTDGVEEANEKLDNKLREIERDRLRRIKDLNRDILNIEQDTANKIKGINASGADKERAIKQRGKSPKKIEKENKNVAWDKLNEGTAAVEEGRATNNQALIDRGTDLINQAQEIGSSLTKQSSALDLVRASTEALTKAQEASGYLSILEKEREKIRENKEAETDRANARNEYADKIGDIQEEYDEFNNLESTRHNTEMANLNAEIIEWGKKLDAAKQIQALAAQAITGGTAAAPAKVDAPVVQGTGQSPISLNPGKIQSEADQIKGIVDSAAASYQASFGTASSAVQNSVQVAKSAIANASSDTQAQINEIATNGYRWVEENGKMVATNLTDTQRQSFRDMADAAKAAAAGQGQEFANEYKDKFQTIRDEYGNVKAVVAEGIKIPMDNSQLQAKSQESLAAVQAIKNAIEENQVKAQTPIKPKIEPDKAPLDTAKQNLDAIGQQTVNPKIEPDATAIGQCKTDIDGIDALIAAPKIVPEKQSLDDAVNSVKELEGKNISVQLVVGGIDELNNILNTIKTEVENKKEINVSVGVEGDDKLGPLKDALDAIAALNPINIVFKLLGIDEGVSGVGRLNTAINELPRERIINIITKYSTEGTPSTGTAAAKTGGLIQAFAKGGEVFKRLKNRFISAGSGTKDDVPALLMKNEFVHRTAAVKKYGVRFMNMVNNLQFPETVARKFASGGIVSNISDRVVQAFSKGGSVLGMAKKRIEDLLGIGSINMNFGSLDVTNNVQKTAERITSPLGMGLVKTMQDRVVNAISGFKDGGKVNTKVMSVAEIAKLSSQYDAKIATATRSGQTEIAELLKKEKEDVIKLAQELTKSLKDLEENYKKQVKERKENYDESSTTRQEEYDETLAKDERNYKEQVEDDNRGYAREDFDYQKSEKDREDDYVEQLAEYKKDLEEELSDYEKDLKETSEELSLLKEKEYEFRKHRTSEKYPKHTFDEWKDAPIEDVLREYYSYKPTTGMKSDNLKGAVFIEGPRKYDEKNYRKGIEGYKNMYGDELDSLKERYDELMKENPQTEYDKNVEEAKKSYAEQKESSDLSRSRSMEDRAIAIFRRDRSYKEGREEADLRFKEAKEKEDTDFKEGVKTDKETYLETVKKTKEDYLQKINDVRTKALEDIEKAKAKIAESVSDTAKTNTVTASTSTSSAVKSSTSEVVTTVQNQRMSIDELLKRLGKGILRFNTGGLVPMIQGAIRGKDSILASLTPKEYVMSESAVNTFGSGFFDFLNHAGKIKGFNAGGLVGSAAGTIQSASRVVHALDININGSPIGEFTGSQMSVEGFIAAMEMAKMRA